MIMIILDQKVSLWLLSTDRVCNFSLLFSLLFYLVYLYNPAMKSGLARKFYLPWTGPYKITKRNSQLNNEIVSQSDKSK